MCESVEQIRALSLRRFSQVVLYCTIEALWFGSFSIEVAARLLANGYVFLGADIPDSTTVVMGAIAES